MYWYCIKCNIRVLVGLPEMFYKNTFSILVPVCVVLLEIFTTVYILSVVLEYLLGYYKHILSLGVPYSKNFSKQRLSLVDRLFMN